MDNQESLWLWQQQENEEEIAEDEYTATLLGVVAAACVVIGSSQARALRAERRRAHRAYLCRPELLPNPREGTSWQILQNSRVDPAYIVTMGFDVYAFEHILASGFEAKWNTIPISRNDVSSHGNPRLGGRSLDASGALGLILHYLNSTASEISLQLIFALTPSTTSRYIDFALRILLDTLRTMPECVIAWPQGTQFEEYAALVQARHRLLFGAFGTIDGLNLPCQTAYNDVDVENATYNGWLHEHFISSVLVFAPDGTSAWPIGLNCHADEAQFRSNYCSMH